MVEVPKTLQDGSTSSLLFWLLRDSFQSPDMGPLENSPLNERGWVFQERILSPRTVHFTATQLVWECREALLTEDLLPLPSADRRHASFFKEFLGSDAYLPLKFTNPEDRLIAISGIAKMGYLRMSSKIRYLAGLWAETLPYGLSWKLPVENSDLPEAPRRPSWTWASHDYVPIWSRTIARGCGWFSSSKNFVPDPCFKFKESNLKYFDSAQGPFGYVTGGSITIMTRTSKVCIRKEKDNSEKPRAKYLIHAKTAIGGLGRAYIDFPRHSLLSRCEKKSVPVPCLILGNGGKCLHVLLVEPSGGSFGQFKRIGVAQIELGGFLELDRWLDTADVVKVNLS
jgi:hypothetical protein